MDEVERLSQKFKDTVHDYINRPGIDSLMDWLEKTDFYIAPASTKYHSAKPGGLVEHSLEVFNEIMFLTEGYGGVLPEVDIGFMVQTRWNTEIRYSLESLAIVALFHDLCKVNFYEMGLKNVKNDSGVWEKAPYYFCNERYPFGGHGSKSVYLIMKHLLLTDDEAAAINCHMGAWDNSSYSNCGSTYEKIPLAWLLHVADESATYIRKK